MDVYMGNCVYKYSAICGYIYIYTYVRMKIFMDVGFGCFLFSLHFHFIENGIITGGMKLEYFSGDYRSNSLGTPGC